MIRSVGRPILRAQRSMHTSAADAIEQRTTL
jgi:hypothetical protein